MSLVILSSQQEFSDSQVSEAIERPNAFQNYFTKPVEVPPDSEVGVVSVKINRTQNFNIGPESRVNVYLGTELTEGQDIEEYSTSIPIKIDLYNRDQETLSPDEFRNRIESKLNEAPLHPDYYGNVNVSLSLDGTTKALEGFDIAFTRKGNGSGLSEQVGSDWIAYSDESIGNASITTLDTYGKRVTKTDGSECIFVAQDYPLANAGEFIFSPKDREENTGTTWGVGLVRPLQLTNNPNNYSTQISSEVAPWWHSDDGNPPGIEGFYDYLVYKDGDEDFIRVYQSMGDETMGQTSLQEIDYEENASNSSFTTPVEIENIRRFKFVLNNEILELYGDEITPDGAVLTISTDDAGSGYNDGTFQDVGTTTSGGGTGLTLDITIAGGSITGVSINDPGSGYANGDSILPDTSNIGAGNDDIELSVATATTEETTAYKLILKTNNHQAPYNQRFKKVGQNQWGLYPIVELNANNDHINVDKFQGRQKPDGSDLNYYTDIYYSNQYIKDRLDPADTYMLDVSYHYNLYEAVNPIILPPYKGMVVSGPNELVDKNVVLILSKNAQYLSIKWDTLQPDIRELLGFDVAVVTQSEYGTTSDNESVITFTSTTTPLPASTRECFVKLESLNIESFNGATSDISKIIYSIPRFDNSGAVVGSLFFENNDRYYLKLNNVAPLLLNRMDVQMVDVRNRIIDGLYGNTCVILHIRKSS